MCQILSASGATLAFRIGLIFCVFQGGSSKSEAKARKTRGKREKIAKRELRAKGASQKNPACPRIIAQGLCFALVRNSGFVLASFSPLFVKIYLRKKLLVFGKLIISTTTSTAHFETVVKVKLVGFQW